MRSRDLPPIDVFAVEDRSAQICWAWLPAPEMTLEIAGQEVCVGTEAPDWYGRVGLRGQVRSLGRRASRLTTGWATDRAGLPDGSDRRGLDGEAPDEAAAGPQQAAAEASVHVQRVAASSAGSPAAVAARPPVGATAGPGAVTITGLEPATMYDVVLRGPGQPPTRVASVSTLPPPPGRLLSRFATFSDCHIGERSVGPLRLFRDPHPRPPGLGPYAVRCTRAAIAEAEAWGAALLIAKGDLTYAGSRHEVEDVAALLQAATVPVEVILGNHDVRGDADTAGLLRAHGIPMTVRPRARDLPGVRLVLGHSPLPDRHAGAVTAADAGELARLAADAPGPVVLAVHHPPRRGPVQTYYPPSIGRGDTMRLVDELAAANPDILIVAGHTHRNRRYQVRGLTVAEVASTKDYPGVWAGYSVYEGGIRQVVYRVAEPSAIAWTEGTRRAIGGIWGWWSRGQLSDRCWTLEWP